MLGAVDGAVAAAMITVGAGMIGGLFTIAWRLGTMSQAIRDLALRVSRLERRQGAQRASRVT